MADSTAQDMRTGGWVGYMAGTGQAGWRTGSGDVVQLVVLQAFSRRSRTGEIAR